MLDLQTDVSEQVTKNARELAQAETARALRNGELAYEDAAAFETKRFKEIRDKQKRQFDETGKLPAGIAQTIAQLVALPAGAPTRVTVTTNMGPVEDPEDERAEFARTWQTINSKLTREEQDLIMTAMSGAEVNHSLLYCVVFCVLGVIAGVLGHAMLG